MHRGAVRGFSILVETLAPAPALGDVGDRADVFVVGPIGFRRVLTSAFARVREDFVWVVARGLRPLSRTSVLVFIPVLVVVLILVVLVFALVDAEASFAPLIVTELEPIFLANASVVARALDALAFTHVAPAIAAAGYFLAGPVAGAFLPSSSPLLDLPRARTFYFKYL